MIKGDQFELTCFNSFYSPISTSGSSLLKPGDLLTIYIKEFTGSHVILDLFVYVVSSRKAIISHDLRLQDNLKVLINGIPIKSEVYNGFVQPPRACKKVRTDEVFFIQSVPTRFLKVPFGAERKIEISIVGTKFNDGVGWIVGDAKLLWFVE